MAILSDFIKVTIELRTGAKGGSDSSGDSVQTEPLLLDSFTAYPGTYAHPPVRLREPVSAVSYEWSSSDYSILNFDSSTAPISIKLLQRGTAILTLVIHLTDGSELKASSTITVL